MQKKMVYVTCPKCYHRFKRRDISKEKLEVLQENLNQFTEEFDKIVLEFDRLRRRIVRK